MNRLDRLQAILVQLQSKRVVRSHEIAERFGVSLRTVFRDMRSLEESGVPIGAEAGVGYYLMDNFSLPPVMFTHEEASALLFAEKLMDRFSDEKIRFNFNSSILKIRAILKPNERDHLELLQDRISVFNNAEPQGVTNLFLYDIQQAMANREVISIVYESGFERELTERNVEPIGLCNYGSRWHLVAWCQLRSDYRDFRLDRIHKLTVTNMHYDCKRHISLGDYIKMQKTLQGETNISIVVPKNRKSFLDRTKHWYGFVEEQELDNGFQMKFVNNELNGFAIWLLNSGCYAIIETPDELKQKVRWLIDSTNRHYKYLYND